MTVTPLAAAGSGDPTAAATAPAVGVSGTITIAAQGTEAAARAYLRALAALPRLVVVEQTSLQPAATETAAHAVTLQLTAKVFATAP